MIVVSDCSPITNLLAIDQLDLLRRLYTTLIIPVAVCKELSLCHQEHFKADFSSAIPWTTVRQVEDSSLVQSLRMELDEGEAEAIALAIQLSADLLLVDEHQGRMSATRMGLRRTGLLGILIDAKQKGYLKDIKPVMDDLILRSGFWIGANLYSRVLREAGEE